MQPKEDKQKLLLPQIETIHGVHASINCYGDYTFSIMEKMPDNDIKAFFVRGLSQWMRQCTGVLSVRIPYTHFYMIPVCKSFGLNMSYLDNNDVIVMSTWCNDKVPDKTPQYGTHQVKVYPIVVREARRGVYEVAIVKELFMNTGSVPLTAKTSSTVGKKREGTATRQHERRWKLPSGNVEHNESFEQACVRETKEELSLSVTFGSVIAITDKKSCKRGQSKITLYCKMSLCEESHAALRIQKDELIEAQWVPIKDLWRHLAPQAKDEAAAMESQPVIRYVKKSIRDPSVCDFTMAPCTAGGRTVEDLWENLGRERKKKGEAPP
jgi:ADP-ribose pyrophosphatase YjhB (NUDIX family)